MTRVPPSVNRGHVRATVAVVDWYLTRYYRTPHDVGTGDTFCEEANVGAFAVSRRALRDGEPAALFRLLVTVTMFQRRQDAQIMRILRGIPEPKARELTSSRALNALAKESACCHLRTLDALHKECDLHKTAAGRGSCRHRPTDRCHLKEHAVLLKRYGHFGKVPTSAAMMLRESAGGDLRELYHDVLARHRRRLDRALALEAAITRSWRVSDKIAAMYLSILTNPDLSPDVRPWTRGVDWRYFIAIDSNVDLFLASIGYEGNTTYAARRSFLRALSQRVSLRAFDRRLHDDNPRLVQQAMFMFMSRNNRRLSLVDCCREGAAACRRCPASLRTRCPVANA